MNAPQPPRRRSHSLSAIRITRPKDRAHIAMLKKIINIKNLARFENYCATGNVELKRYTLMFAENGRGKTTLCALLRSLQAGEPAIVQGRATLGGSGAPEV